MRPSLPQDTCALFVRQAGQRRQDVAAAPAELLQEGTAAVREWQRLSVTGSKSLGSFVGEEHSRPLCHTVRHAASHARELLRGARSAYARRPAHYASSLGSGALCQLPALFYRFCASRALSCWPDLSTVHVPLLLPQQVCSANSSQQDSPWGQRGRSPSPPSSRHPKVN